MRELKCIPISDPVLLHLPTEPLEDIWDRYGIDGKTEVITERLAIEDRKVLEEIQRAATIKGHPKTATCWDDDAACMPLHHSKVILVLL